MEFIGSGDVIAVGNAWEIYPNETIYVTGTLSLQGIPTTVIVQSEYEADRFEKSLAYRKRLHYIVKQLIPNYLLHTHPEWKELMEVFLKYLDEKVYQKIIGIENVININNKDITDELIMELFNQYGSGLVNEEFIEIDIDDRKNFAQLGKYINNLKGTKLSLEYLFRYLGQSQIVGLVDKKVFEYILEEIRENKDLLQIDPEPNPKLFIAPFTYNIVVNQIFYDLPKLLESVHPAGFNYLILYENLLQYVESFSVSNIQGKVKKIFPYRYDGLYKRVGYHVGEEHSYPIQNKPILYVTGYDIGTGI